MIDLNTYRQRIGSYNPSFTKSNRNNKGYKHNVGGFNNVNFCIKGSVGLKSGFLIYKDTIDFCITGNGNLDVGLLVYYVFFFVYLLVTIHEKLLKL